jgi:copper(I)-binding protein
MFRLNSLLAAAALITLAACAPAQPASYSAESIAVAEPFSRPAPQGGNGAGFFTVTNNNTGPDTLLRVESPIATRIELHETSTEGGVMRMRELKAGLKLKAGETVVFKPGGKHVMFLGLVRPLAVGDRIPATLVFEKAGRAPIELTVKARDAAPAGGMDEHAH